MRNRSLALVAPTAAVARRLRPLAAARFPGARLVPVTLGRFARDEQAPVRVVLCPSGESVEADFEFLRRTRRSILWPPPAEEIWNAIAGLRGSHDAAPAGANPTSRGRGRRSALLLEGVVTARRARKAAASGAPRDWIVERVQRVRIGSQGLDELTRLGVRWATLEPVEVVALVATRELVRIRPRWAKWLPPDVAVWTLAADSDLEGRSSK